MNFLDGLRAFLAADSATTPAERLTGRPTSSNRASSHHLFWMTQSNESIVEIRATLEIVKPPKVAELYFWALQASFTDGSTNFGGAHLGLQHHRSYPDSGAANWGGYHDASRGGQVLDGSPLTVPSALNNANTGNFAWRPQTPYVLRIRQNVPNPDPENQQGWLGSITGPDGVENVLRELYCAGSAIRSPLVWTESFAPCDAPRATVRWSNLTMVTRSGAALPIRAVRTNFQSVADGGCSTSDSTVDGASVLQSTGVSRTTSTGAILDW
jgi:hypothetical protein